MSSNPNHRAFLLGMSDPESERLIEEGILGNRIDSGEMEQLEDELIDDYVLGRLSGEEARHFETHFLCNDQRGQRLRFARALNRVANDIGTVSRKSFGLRSRFWWTARMPLTVALSLCLLALAWLSVRDIRLSHALLKARENRTEARIATQTRPQVSSEPPQSETSAAFPPPDLILTLGVGEVRGLPSVPVLRIQPHQTQVRIDVELPTGLGGAFCVELRPSGNNPVWSGEFSVHHLIRPGESTTLILPAQRFSPGNNQIWIGQTLAGGEIRWLGSRSIWVPKG